MIKPANPFRRFIAYMTALSAALELQSDIRPMALAKLGTYESRSKGKGRVTYAKGNPWRNGHWGANNPNGDRAMARRRQHPRTMNHHHFVMLTSLRSNANKRAGIVSAA